MTQNIDPAQLRVTPLGMRVLSLLADGKAYRKASVARDLGIGRGSANRIVDDLVSKGCLVKAGSSFTAKVFPSQSKTISDRILDLLISGPLSHRDILSRIQGVKPASVSVALVRLAKEGRARRAGWGVYEIVHAATKPEVGAELIRSSILSFRKGMSFTADDVMRACECSYTNVGNVLPDLIEAGVIAKVSRGVYARLGKDPGSLRGKIPRSQAVRELLASEDRAWHASEVQARLGPDYPDFKAYYVLQNTWRVWGNPVKVGRALWRAVPSESPAEAPSPGLPEIIRGILSGGGLWTPDEIRQASGRQPKEGMVRLALEGLRREGFAVHVFMGYWKARTAKADLPCSERATTPVRFLLACLRNWPNRLPASENLKGFPQKKRWLIERGYLVDSLPTVCTEAFVIGLKARLAPRPALPPLTDLGHRMVMALEDRHALTRVEVAERLGIGRGSVNRMVERLIGEGWVSDVGGGRIIAI